MDSMLEEIAWEGLPEEAPRGSSQGNRDCFLRADAEANLDGLWLAANNRWYSGELKLRVTSPEETLRRVTHAPAFQSAQYSNEQGGSWKKTLFLSSEGAVVNFWIHGEDFGEAGSIEIACDWRVCAARSEKHRAQPASDCERQWALETEEARYRTVCPLDGGQDRQWLKMSHAPVEQVWTEPARLQMWFSIPYAAGSVLDFWMSLKAHPGDEEDLAWETYQLDPALMLKNIQERQAAEIQLKTEAVSLAPAIHRAVAWGKIGSRRVWHRYGTGDWGFTNDPPGNTVVTRDAAWFVFGADHFAPKWSRSLLETLAHHAVYPSGKIAEYVRLASEGVTRDDYDLNINDATPLYILAVEHHWNWTQDKTALQTLYPTVQTAADWIIKQIGEKGLVWCQGRGTNVQGIGGWRNIIPGYRLSGALTELNALCVAALRGAGRLAEAFGNRGVAQNFTQAAEHLNVAMAHLVDPDTGLFALTLDKSDADGLNSQLAVDLVFPALFEAGPEEARIKTVKRLVEKDFRCARGLCALSKFDPAYHPRFGWGLMGGSWPNATAWAAAAIAPYRPDLAWQFAEAIAQSLFPQKDFPSGVSVPGQFPEWFDGNTGESAGMSLSPWMPATYVWLIQERLRDVPQDGERIATHRKTLHPVTKKLGEQGQDI